MTTYREAIYMCLDLVKGMSDDFSYTEEHVAFLIDKTRALLLKQRYGNDPKKHVPYSNYQSVTVKFIPQARVNPIISTSSVPYMLQIGIPRINKSIGDYYNYKYEFTSRERLPFTGNNKYTNMITYFAINENGYVITPDKDSYWTPDKRYVGPSQVTLVGIFENPREVITYDDYLDSPIPIEEGLINNLIEMVVQKLAGSMYIPNDDQNNAKDDKADIYSFLAKNTKSDLAKQLS